QSCLFECTADHRALHSFPTRRSSDLTAPGQVGDAGHRAGIEYVGHREQPRGDAADAVVEERRGAPGLDIEPCFAQPLPWQIQPADRKSTRLNSSHLVISYAVFCLKKK